jgi:hypothetical protein
VLTLIVTVFSEIELIFTLSNPVTTISVFLLKISTVSPTFKLDASIFDFVVMVFPTKESI